MKERATDWARSERCEAVLDVRGLGKQFVERRPFTSTRRQVSAIDGVDLKLRPGTTLAIVGESGAGKSTLARCIALIERPTRGEIWFEGRDLLALGTQELRALRGKIQLIFQDPSSALNPRMTAEEIVTEPLAVQGIGTKSEQRDRAVELLQGVDLSSSDLNKTPMEFSGGQRQRLAIARALALEPRVLILDEACSGLDLKTQELILGLLARFQATLGMSFIYVSHDLRAVADFADEIAVMYRGRIVENKPTAELFQQPEDSYTQELLAAMPTMETICERRLAGVSQ